MMIREWSVSTANQIENFNRAGHGGGGLTAVAGALVATGTTRMAPSELTSTLKS
jgi:hypothetical protein